MDGDRLPAATASPTPAEAPSTDPASSAPPTAAAICQVAANGGTFYLYVTGATADTFIGCAGGTPYAGAIDDLLSSTRPDGLVEARETARCRLAEVPKLVPIYGHRFLPGRRRTFGHPVLSVMQTDIIYYGMDLIDYVHQEFGGPGLDRTDERWNA